MQRTALNNGTKIPAIGFGLWRVKDEQECKTAVKDALSTGYRHFDTAQAYENEVFLGDVLEQSDVPRNDLFITTKISVDNLFPQNIIPAFEESLKNLRTDYVDLLLVPHPTNPVS